MRKEINTYLKMSYLPRMSKTYKEPQQNQPEETEMSTSNLTLKPASSLLTEKTHNPQVALKHYRYLPHPLPVLPGPSLFEEAEENELQREASRLKRSSSKIESQSKVNLDTVEALVPEPDEAALSDVTHGELSEKNLSRPLSKKSVKGSKSHSGRKKPTKYIKKEKSSEIEINVCVVGDTAIPYSAAQIERGNRKETLNSEFIRNDEINLDKKSKTHLPFVNHDFSSTNQQPKENLIKQPEKQKSEVMPKEHVNHSVQCTIFGSTKKTFVIPLVIHSLLRSLALLLRELHREDVLSSVSGERRTLMTQIQLILGDLCNQKVESEYGFDVTYSDSKRFEKIFGDLQKYMKDIYGDKEEYIDKMDDLKKVFIDLKRKEMEVDILTNKLKDMQGQGQTPPELVLKESDLRNPEITLQNKRLESEQLFAEIEFSCRELLNYQKTLAEIDWDIRNLQDQIASLKKSASKSKSEVLGRRGSLYKFSSDLTAKGSKSKENDVRAKKKT